MSPRRGPVQLNLPRNILSETAKFNINKNKKYLWTFNTYDDKEDEFTDRNVFPMGCIKEMTKILI